MASYTGIATAKHATLTANTVDAVSFSRNFRAIEVKNRGTTGDIYFRIDGVDPSPTSTDNNYIVLPGESLVISDDWTGDTVRLVSAGTPAYSVTGVDLA
jgi:hypothetical protein